MNDKFFFIKHLFNGDHNNYDKAMQHINFLTSFDLAKTYIQRELAVNNNITNNDEAVDRLLAIVEKKFNS